MRQEEVEAHVDDIFSRLDTNRDGVVTIEEFVEACQRVSVKYRVPQQVLDNIWGQEIWRKEESCKLLQIRENNILD